MNSIFNTIHLVTGPPASGKTTFGHELAQARAATFLDIDLSTETLIRATMVALEMNPDDRDSERFKTLFRIPIYDTLFDTARANIGHTDVVITGPFTSEFQNPRWLDEVATKTGKPCHVKAYYLHSSNDELRARMIQRDNPRDAGKLKNWAKFLSYHKNQKPPAFPHTEIDTSHLNPKGRLEIIAAIQF